MKNSYFLFCKLSHLFRKTPPLAECVAIHYTCWVDRIALMCPLCCGEHGATHGKNHTGELHDVMSSNSYVSGAVPEQMTKNKPCKEEIRVRKIPIFFQGPVPNFYNAIIMIHYICK